MNKYNVAEAIVAQKKFASDNEAPHFAPRDGVCWSCNQNIYDTGGVSVKRASSELITGCPHCHRTYCD